jgi:hypothetical protein
MEVDAEEYKNFLRFKLIPELAVIMDRVKLFEQKYNKSFQEFEQFVNESEENFEFWDAYIEWKAYIETMKDINLKLDKLEND